MMRAMMRVVLATLIGMSALVMAGCSSNEAKPAALAGDQAHERHATGIESHVGDM